MPRKKLQYLVTANPEPSSFLLIAIARALIGIADFRFQQNKPSIKERGEFLKLAFTAVLKDENAGSADDAMAQYAEFRKRQDEGNEEAHQKEAPTPRPDAEAERILRYFQTTPYRTKDRERSD